jgi:hypothetical protein
MSARGSTPTFMLNDQGPYLNSEDDGPRMPKGIDQKSPNQADLLDQPSQLTTEDVPEISKTMTTPTTSIHPMTTAKKHGQRTKHAHDIFDRIEQQIAELSQELDLFTDAISLEDFVVVEWKCIALQEGLTTQEWKTESLDAKKAQLIAQLKALNGRIQAARALLRPSKSPLKYSNGEVLSLVSVVLSSLFLVKSCILCTKQHLKVSMKSVSMTEAAKGGLHLHSPLRVHIYGTNVRSS